MERTFCSKFVLAFCPVKIDRTWKNLCPYRPQLDNDTRLSGGYFNRFFLSQDFATFELKRALNLQVMRMMVWKLLSSNFNMLTK